MGDRIFSETQQLEQLHTPSVEEKQAVSVFIINVSANSGKGEGWRMVTSGKKRKAPVPPNYLQLQNRVTILKAEDKPDVPTSKEPGPPNPKLCKTTRKKWRVIRMGDSLLP